MQNTANSLIRSPSVIGSTRLPPTIATLVILAVAAAVLIGCSSTPEVEDTSRNGTDPQADPIATGQKVFAANCAACHGVGGEGQPNWHIRKADGTLPAPPLNGDGHTWHHGDGLLYRIVSEGGAALEAPGLKSAMPPFREKLSHQEIVAVLTYVKSLWEGKMSRGLFIIESQAFASQHDPFPPEASR